MLRWWADSSLTWSNHDLAGRAVFGASGHVADAVPVCEGLVEGIPDMSFPLSSLLRAQAFLQDWDRVDRLLALAGQRPLREFQDAIPFVRAKRDPSPTNIGAWRSELQARVTRTGHVDVARLVFAAHPRLVGETYEAADRTTATASVAMLSPGASRAGWVEALAGR